MEEAIDIPAIPLCNTKGFNKFKKMEEYFGQSLGKTYSKTALQSQIPLPDVSVARTVPASLDPQRQSTFGLS
jgi:hypothetical protein